MQPTPLMQPTPPREHEPGEPHRYRVTCEVCGETGTVRLSVDPQNAPYDPDRIRERTDDQATDRTPTTADAALFDADGDPVPPDPHPEDWYDGYSEGQRDCAEARAEPRAELEALNVERRDAERAPLDDIGNRLRDRDKLRDALEIIAAPSEHAPDAIGVTARNIARAALSEPKP